jgi:hypothetical protein
MKQLEELVARLERAYAHRLVSVVLYGSAASAGDHDEHFSDLNVLCVLKQVTPAELSDGEPVLRWWRETGHPSPLLMSEEEVHNSSDSFPIEFRDMQDNRKVLHGVDVIAHVKIDPKYYRAELEHELRSKLFRLRQQAAGVLSDQAALLRLCVDSVSTFCVLGRHLLLLAGAAPSGGRRDMLRGLSGRVPLDARPFETLLDIREKKAASADAAELFAGYLESIRKMVEFVDQWEDGA